MSVVLSHPVWGRFYGRPRELRRLPKRETGQPPLGDRKTPGAQRGPEPQAPFASQPRLLASKQKYSF